jgi:hypothetical protein
VASEFESRLEKLLCANGISRWRYSRRGKHRAVTVQYGGKDHVFFFPQSGSDRRGPLNFAAMVRRQLGLRRFT